MTIFPGKSERMRNLERRCVLGLSLITFWRGRLLESNQNSRRAALSRHNLCPPDRLAPREYRGSTAVFSGVEVGGKRARNHCTSVVVDSRLCPQGRTDARRSLHMDGSCK
jgi:hypothetical protein